MNSGERRRLHELLEEQGYRVGQDKFELHVDLGRLRAGFASPQDKLAVLSEREAACRGGDCPYCRFKPLSVSTVPLNSGRLINNQVSGNPGSGQPVPISSNLGGAPGVFGVPHATACE